MFPSPRDAVGFCSRDCFLAHRHYDRDTYESRLRNSAPVPVVAAQAAPVVWGERVAGKRSNEATQPTLVTNPMVVCYFFGRYGGGESEMKVSNSLWAGTSPGNAGAFGPRN